MNENDCFRGDCHFHSRTLENISLLGYRWVCARISVASTAAYNRSQYCAAFIRALWVHVRLVIGVNLYFSFEVLKFGSGLHSGQCGKRQNRYPSRLHF